MENVTVRNFTTDFDYFWNLIDNEINFAFARYADGEVSLMKGISVGTATQAFRVDKWNAPMQMTKAGQDLLKTLNHTENNYFYAISGKNDSMDDYTFLRNNIAQSDSNITFVNLWINNNYHRTKEKYMGLKRNVILIANEKANIDKFPFSIIDQTKFPDDCVNFWETNSEKFIEDITIKYKNIKNTLFFVSCGPVSEIIISELYKSNPDNTYVDVGSSIDEFVHGYQTRPFMDSNSPYSRQISSF